MPRKKTTETVNTTPKKKSTKKSSERTRIITAKITLIEKISDNEKDSKMSKKEKMAEMEKQLKKSLNADNVKVSNVQDFILDC